MEADQQPGFFGAIKGKVIIALLLACFALTMAWLVSKVAFEEMLTTVENISAPNERLRIVSTLSRQISGMDELQRKQSFNDPGNYKKIFKASRQLRLVLDTLQSLYHQDPRQLKRIASIHELLAARDQQFINYLKVREGLVNNTSFSTQVKKLNELVTKNKPASDSTVVTSTKKTSTTTIFPSEEINRSRGFFSKIFGKKKEEAGIREQPYKIINEENIKRDTIALANERGVVEGLEASLKRIEQEQQNKSTRFINMEAELANANGLLISRMLSILRKVENEAVAQIELNSIQAKTVVNTGINRISIIMLVFFLLTILLLYLILTDITKSNRYRNALESARDEAEYHGRAKQRFLSNMSHEIRTPLQSIIGYAEIINTQEHPEHKDVKAIHNSAEHLLQIVNEVLDYNRITSGKFSFSSQPFDIRKLLEEVRSGMLPQAEAKSLKLKTDFQLDPLSEIEGDAFRLKQILFNLLSNAIKFTQEGEVTLSAFYKRQEDLLHFTFVVKDTGIGFSEEAGIHIFNEFEQVESPEKESINQTGAGLGLTIVKSLVEHQGGRIYAQSKEQSGSSFTVYLTFKYISNTILKAKAEESSRLLLTTTKVWMIDDDQLILDLCSLIFEKHHINYTCFQRPLDLLNTPWDPDVKYVFMDIRMPEMSGIELCKILRKTVAGGVKIFAVTAQVLPEERTLMLSQGFDGLIQKPFREHDLLAVLKEIAFDPKNMEQMTFGDAEQMEKILDRFALDSKADGMELIQTLAQQEHEQTILLLHRIAGRTAQIGSAKLAKDFRLMEIELRKATEASEAQKEKIKLMVNQLDDLLVVMAHYSIS
jgi:signal transduction histidine kinase/FixJ family two-component response regulator